MYLVKKKERGIDYYGQKYKNYVIPMLISKTVVFIWIPLL